MSIKKDLLSNKLAIDSLAAMSGIFSSWMREGVFFFHQGRCGSRVVADLLGQHPMISSYKEIFNKYFNNKVLPAKPANMLLQRRVRAFKKYAVIEAKFFECQHLSLLGMEIAEFVDVLKRCGFRKFIILDRENYLRKIVSALISKKRGGKWHYKVTEQMPMASPIYLDIENVRIQGKSLPILELFVYMDEQYQKLRCVLEGDDVIEMTYEKDIFNDPMVAYTKVCHWLGLESLPVSVNYKKTNVMSLNKAVENWDEVSETLAGTIFEWMVSSD